MIKGKLCKPEISATEAKEDELVDWGFVSYLHNHATICCMLRKEDEKQEKQDLRPQ